MTVWDLSRLRYTVRKITGKFDVNQLPDGSPGPGQVSVSNPPGIDDYINDFYLYDLDEHLRLLRLKDYFTFTTLPNCGTYALPQYIFQVEPPIYIDNYQFAWYQWPDIFYRIWPELNFIDAAIDTTVGGTQKTYTFTLTQTPVQQGTVVIGLQPNLDNNPSPALETFVDTDHPIPLDVPLSQFFVNPGNLTGSFGGTGTVDYLTGAVTINYNTAPPAGLNINAHYHPYVASRPRDILFFQQQLFLRPIPNDVYAVKLLAQIMPSVALNAATNTLFQPQFDPITGTILGFNGGTSPTNPNLSNVPEYNEWWQLIAYGAALKILVEEGDHEEYARNKVYFEEAKLLAQRRTLKQLANQRIQTPYAENVAGPAFPIFPIY